MTNFKLLAIPLLICAAKLLGVSMGQMESWTDVQRISKERFQQCKVETRTVVFESLKARGGQVYKRTLTKDWIYNCMTRTQLDAKNIFHCANLAEKAGLNGFAFLGACIGIGEILPWTTADGCDDFSDLVVVYAADPPLNDTEFKFDEPGVTAEPLDFDNVEIKVNQSSSCEWKHFKYTINGKDYYIDARTALLVKYDGLERCKDASLTVSRLSPNGQEIGPLIEHVYFVPAGPLDTSGFFGKLSLTATVVGKLTRLIEWNEVPELCGSLKGFAVNVFEFTKITHRYTYSESLLTHYDSGAGKMTLGPIVELCLAYGLEFFGFQQVGTASSSYYTYIYQPLAGQSWTFSYSKDANTLTVDWSSAESVDVCGLLPGVTLNFTTYLSTEEVQNAYPVAYDDKSITLPDALSFDTFKVTVPSLQDLLIYYASTSKYVSRNARADAALTTFSECVQLGRDSGRRLLTLRDGLHLRDEDTWIEHTPSDAGLTTARAEGLREVALFAGPQNDFCAVARAGDARARRVDCASQQRCVTIEN